MDLLLVSVIIISMLSACVTLDQKRSDVVQKAVSDGLIVEGMHMDAVKASWGKPKKKYKKMYGATKVWIWEYEIVQPDTIDTFELIFRDNRLLQFKRKYIKPKKKE